jgi:hypothetical protein
MESRSGLGVYQRFISDRSTLRRSEEILNSFRHNRGMYIDAYAIIVQKDLDGGDSLHREGLYAFGKWLRYNREANSFHIDEIPERQDPGKIMDKFEVQPGIYVRHPDPNKWYSNPDTTSRDQLIAVIAYCAAYKDYPRLWRLFKAVAGRGFFAQNVLRNGDVPKQWKVPDTMLGHLGLFIRAGGWWTAPLYPLLYVTDALDLMSTVLQQFPLHFETARGRFRLKERRDVDDNNTILAHLMAAHFKPTPISWLDRIIYSYTRRENLGNTIMGERNRVMGAMTWYHREEARGNPELAQLYRPLIEEFFASPGDHYSRFHNRLAQFAYRRREQ